MVPAKKSDGAKSPPPAKETGSGPVKSPPPVKKEDGARAKSPPPPPSGENSGTPPIDDAKDKT